MANFFYHDKSIVGLDFGKTSIKVVSLDSEKMQVEGYGSVELDPVKAMKALDDPENPYLHEQLNSLFEDNIIGTLSSSRVVLGVPTARTFARTFTIPLGQISAVKDAVNLEVDQYVPMPLESLYVDYEIIKKTDKEATVLMCAISRPFLDNTLAIVRRHAIDVAMIEPSVNAVARVLKRTEEGGLPTVIVDIGPTSTDIAILDGAVRVTGSLGVGGNTFTLAIADHLDVALENAHQLKVINGLSSGPRRAKIQQALKPSLQRIITETKKVVRYYTERFASEGKLEQVLVVGSGSNVPGIGEYFTDALVMPARVASPWQSLDFGSLEAPTKQLRARYITAVGLGMVEPREIWND